MADPQPLTRSELAKFLPDHRSIRAFENLFAVVPADSASFEVQIQETSIEANTAAAKANQAISGVVKSEIKAKSNGVLIWLSM